MERLYRKYRRLLLYVAARKFGVPDADAEALLQETMIAFLTTHTRIDNPKMWLVATMCNVSRRYSNAHSFVTRIPFYQGVTEPHISLPTENNWTRFLLTQLTAGRR